MTKSFLTSRTIWLAILQAVAGVLVVAISENPELGGVGWLMIAKSGVDICIRFLTTKELR